MSLASGLLGKRVCETPIAVIDFETTGLTPGFDRAVELCIVRIDPGQRPRLAFDTLINPERPMAATEIHGISDEDVVDAPRFADVAGDVARALNGCVVAAYNVYFDMKFFDYEMRHAGLSRRAPHFCLMYLRPMLGLGPRCRLDQACSAHGISIRHHHAAAADTQAAAELAILCLAEMQRKGIDTFEDLANLKSYKFTESWEMPPVDANDAAHCPACGKVKSRSGFRPFQQAAPEPAAAPPLDPPTNPADEDRLRIYWESLKEAIADLDVTEPEVEQLARVRAELGLPPESVRSLHARAFASVITQFTQDRAVDDREAGKLRKIHECLAKAGYAPGL